MPRIKSKQIIGERPVRPEHLTTKEYVDEVLNRSALEKRRMAYFHSLSKIMTNANQNINENRYKASHNIRINDIWSDNISFSKTFQEAHIESLSNSAVKFYNNVPLTEIYGSNGQSYCFIENGTFKDDSYPINERGQLTSGSKFIRPLISPEDIFDEITNEISYGYELLLFRGYDATSGTPGEEITPNDDWYVDYYSGTIHFTENNTPNDLGYGTITATFFKYDGKYVSDIYNNIFLSAVFENNNIIFNKGENNEQILDLSTLILSNTINNITLNNSKELVVSKNDNTIFKINLKPLLNDVVNNVTFYENTKILTFYKNDIPFLNLDIADILSKYDNAFVDADIDLLNDQLLFTRYDGTTYSIQLSQLQDRSAFNTVDLSNNTLRFITQSNDVSVIDLNYLDLGEMNPDIFVDAQFNKTNNILSFNLINGNLLKVDLSSLKTLEGTTSYISALNLNMPALDTTDTSKLACIIPLLSPNVDESNVLVFLNGVQIVVGNDDECECYFSSDDGITKNALNNIKLGDKLYWNYVNGLPVSGYNLSSLDRISFNYLNFK